MPNRSSEAKLERKTKKKFTEAGAAGVKTERSLFQSYFRVKRKKTIFDEYNLEKYNGILRGTEPNESGASITLLRSMGQSWSQLDQKGGFTACSVRPGVGSKPSRNG